MMKAKVSKVEEVEASSADTSVRTKLPSFSSIIMSTSPPEQPVVASPQQELAAPTNFPSTFTTTSPTRAPSPSPSSSPAFPQNAPVLHSAPGSPTLHYPTSSTYPRRASLGATQRLSDECAAALILGLSRGDMVSPPDTSAEEHANFQRFRTVAWSAASPPPTSTWSSPSTPTSTWSSPPPPTSAWTSVPSLTTWTSAAPAANSTHSDQEFLPPGPPGRQQVASPRNDNGSAWSMAPPTSSWPSSSPSTSWASSMSTSISAWSSSQTASCLSMAPSEPRPALPGILRSVGRAQTNSPDPRAPGSGLGTGTHVTFSEELSHPIPSVSPAKEVTSTAEKKRDSNGLSPPSESNEIFSDLESVLSEAADFSFHSALASAHTGADRLTVKTPEKLLTSVPPAVIMEQKKSQLPFPPSCSSSSSTSPPSSSPFPPPSPPSSAFPSPSPTSFPPSAL